MLEMNKLNINFQLPPLQNLEVIDAEGKFVLPAFCDSHTHTVFAKSREEEFVDRINGLSYEEIAQELDKPLGTVKAQLHRSRELLYEIASGKENQI